MNPDNYYTLDSFMHQMTKASKTSAEQLAALSEQIKKMRPVLEHYENNQTTIQSYLKSLRES